MMSTEIKSTAPKPFVFVLMPFKKEFNNIYKFGIKGAAEDAGAYAERVDEQKYDEVILERIFNQISKADVIVADMTDRNPNVFYEVGYAHALEKIVLLLTQNRDDIPFDLKHRPHIEYHEEIETLRKELTERLIWAIGESKRRGRETAPEQFLVTISGKEIPEAHFSRDVPVLKRRKGYSGIIISIRNGSLETTPPITHIYLFTAADSTLNLYSTDIENEPNSEYFIIDSIKSKTLNAPTGLTQHYRLENNEKPSKIPALPPGAVEEFYVFFSVYKDELLTLRIHSPTNHYDFPFKIELKLPDTKKSE